MLKNKFDTKSRFRILKGGKISLVVSALITSITLATPTFAAEVDNTTVNNTQEFEGDKFDFEVTNTGIIDIVTNGDVEGIYSDVLYDGYTVTNNGSISVVNTASHALGIRIDSSTEAIINNNSIYTQTDGNITSSIYVTFAKEESSITNNVDGYITSESNSGNAYGIITKVESKGDITNSGTISATSISGNAIGIQLDGYAFGPFDGVKEANILNEGIVTAESESGAATGIGVNDTSFENSSINNTETIDATSTNGFAYGISITSDNSGTITNSGSINATANNHYGFGINVSNNVDGTIENTLTGEITVEALNGVGINVLDNNGDIENAGIINVSSSSADESFGILVQKAYDNSAITNSGTIIVDAQNSSAGISNGDLLNDNKYNNEVTNSGTITATIDGEADKEAISIFSSSSNSSITNTYIDSTHQGILNGNIVVLGTLTNSGTINLPYNATGGFGSGSAYIATLVNSGTIQIGLQTDGTIGNTTHSQLVTGTATFNSGSELYVNVLNTSTDQDLLVGETLDDVITSSNLIINDLTVDDNSALLDFEYIDDGNDNIDLNIVAATDSSGDPVTVLSTTILGGGASTAQDGAKVIDEIRTEGGNGFTNKFNALSSPQVAKAADEFTPQTATAGISAANQIVSDISGIVDQRQTGFINRGLSSGDEMFTERSFWMKPFGSIGEQSDKDGLNGFDVTTYGLGMGIDGTNKDDQQFGLGVFLTKGNVEVNNLTQETDLDAYTVLAYGSTPVIDDKTRFLYQLGYTWQKSDMSKTNLGETVTADYTSKIASLDLKLLRNYQVNEKLLLQPMVSTSYKHFTNPAYSENGSATSGAVDVNKYTTSELLLGIGTLAHYKLDSDSKILANVNVDYDLQDKNNNLTYSYAGQSAEVTSIDNGRLSYDIGIGYERDLNDTSNFNISYNRTGKGSDYSNNTISAKFVYKF